MARDFAKSFYRSKAWQECRNAYFDSVFGLCERCGAGGSAVHHKTYLTPQNISDPEVSLGWDNLELLCIDCHAKEHGRPSTAGGIGFDENGDVIYTPPVVKN